MTKSRIYKKGDFVRRWLYERTIYRRWHVVSEREVSGYNAGKGIILGLIFLPLALFGFGKQIEVTYSNETPSISANQ